MKRRLSLIAFLFTLPGLLPFAANASASSAADPSVKEPPLSGAAAFRDVNFGTGLTECPQAGITPLKQPQPLDTRTKDKVEQVSQAGDEQRANFEYSCFPQDETSIDVNPRNPRNAVAGANDYRLGWGTSGFYATTDNGNNWYTGIIPFPSLPSGDNLDGGGDPAIVYDSASVVYYADINFNRTDDTNGIFVSRSTNGGFTWSRPCVPINPAPGTNQQARCGGAGDPRRPGDGVVIFEQDPDEGGPGSVPFNDKEYIAVGPRPFDTATQDPADRIAPVCFDPVTDEETGCDPAVVGAGRIYVTWTQFDFGPTGNTFISSKILLSFSDDQARSWSPPRAISGSAPFCMGFPTGADCNINQFSVPTVHPVTGFLGVAFQNFNTPDENQYLFVRSRDGGQTIEGPFFVTPVFDANYPRSGRTRPDCSPRGQQRGRAVLTNSCFRVNSGGAVVVDPRTGEFSDDLYLVMSDNRNGTQVSSNTDAFLFVSKDGGMTWIGPTRVNNDPSQQPANRNCARSECDPRAVFGNDQWFPWLDINDRGNLNVNFYDRRLDQDSVASEWPTSRQRPGNYLVWRFGGVCTVTTTGTVTQETTDVPQSASQCIAPTAQIIPQPTEPVDPGDEQFPEQTAFPFKNFSLSDVPNNWDYSFRAGIFAGDYDVVALSNDGKAWATWTDARNGRSSRNQPGRNPACEQSDVFFQIYGAASGGAIGQAGQQFSELFTVTPCPADMQDPGTRTP